VPSDRADGDRVEHFLVDGVAPPVIGGGPPESPFDPEPDPEPPGRHARADDPPRAPRAAGPPVDRRVPEPSRRTEPPTSPIPVIQPLPQQQPQGKKKSWVAKVFRLPGN
jgi:hypothetical protein